MRAFVTALSLLMLGSSAMAGPKPPASNVFEPEIGYTYASGNTMDLRLANRAGDKAVLVHRTAFGALGSFDLSDETSKRIAYQDGGKVYVRSWQINNGSVSIGAPSLVFADANLRAENVDFSADGSKLAISANAINSTIPLANIVIFDFNVNDDPATPFDDRITFRAGLGSAFGLRWMATENKIYYYGRPNSSGQNQIHVLDPFGIFVFLPPIPTPATLPINFDVSRSSAIVPQWIAIGSGVVTELRDTQQSTVANLNLTSFVHFNCRGDTIIARNHATRRESTAIRTVFPSLGTPVIWSSDSNIHHTDWMQRVPCL